jgi:hypothetical protein
MKSEIVATAKKNNCTFYFEDFDFCKSFNYIYNFTFPDNEQSFVSFVHHIKRFKIKIDMIGYDDKVIYASKKYLKLMNKDKAREYISSKKYNYFKINNPEIYCAMK